MFEVFCQMCVSLCYIKPMYLCVTLCDLKPGCYSSIFRECPSFSSSICRLYLSFRASDIFPLVENISASDTFPLVDSISASDTLLLYSCTSTVFLTNSGSECTSLPKPLENNRGALRAVGPY